MTDFVAVPGTGSISETTGSALDSTDATSPDLGMTIQAQVDVASKEYAEKMLRYDALIAQASTLVGRGQPPRAGWTRDTYDIKAHRDLRKEGSGDASRLASDIESTVLDAETASYNIWFHSEPAQRRALYGKWVYVLDQTVCLKAFDDDEEAYAECLLNRKLGPLCGFTTRVGDSPRTLPRERSAGEVARIRGDCCAE